MKTTLALPFSLVLFALPVGAFGADALKPKPEASADAAARTVGLLGSSKRLEFEGNATFSAEQLRHGLRTHADWLLAAHPAAPLADLLKVTQAAVERGYQRSGFPMVKVAEVRLEANPDRLLCVITEGPRYTAGEVTVSGAKSMAPDLIIQKLTTAEKKDDNKDKQKVSTSHTRSIEWKKGKPAPLDAARPRELQSVVLKFMEQVGLMQAKVQIDIVRDDTARTAALHVKILDEGPAAVLDKIEFTGLKRDSAAEVLKYLGLARGQPFLSGRVPEIENLLLQSARYTSYKVTATPRKADQPEMNLKIELVEMPEAPKLGVALNDTQKTLLLATAWVNEVVRTGSEDLLLKLSFMPKNGGRQDLELIYNSRHGTHLTLTATDDVAGTKNPRRFVMRYVKDEMTGFFSMQDGRVKQWLHAPSSKNWVGNFYVNIETDEPKDGVTLGTTKFGGGLKQADADSVSELILTMTPAAALLDSVKNAGLFQRRDGLLIKQTPAAPGGNDFSVIIDAKTGRIRDLESGRWDKEHTEYIRFTATTAVGAWDRATQELQAQSAGLANAYDGKDALASWAGFLTSGALQGGLGMPTTAKSEDIPRRSQAAYDLTHRLSEGMTELYDACFVSAGDGFWVPKDPGKPVETKLTGSMISQYALYMVDSLVSDGTWPWLLAREVFYSMNGRNEHAGVILNQVIEDPQLGPVGCYLAAGLLDWTLPVAAGGFRQLALTKMTAQDFRKDWGLLVQNVPLRQRVEGTALLEKIRSGGQVEVGLLQDVFGNLDSKAKTTFAPSLQTFVTALRSDTQRPLAEALISAMDQLWDKQFANQLKAALTPKGKDGQTVDPAKVAALVGGTEISREELDETVAARVKDMLVPPGATQAALKAQRTEVEQAALKDLINMEVYVAAFKALGNTYTREQSDADINGIIKRDFKGDKARMERELIKQGVTLEGFRRKRERLVIAQALRQKIGGLAPPPTEAEIQQALKLKAAEEQGMQVQLRTLSIQKVSSKQGAADQQKLAADIHAKLKAGQEFGPLAKEFSTDSRAAEGGKMDWVDASFLSPAIAVPLAKMKPGELSAVLDLGTLWFIMKFEGERQQSKPAAQLKTEVVAELKKQKTNEFLANWLSNTREKLNVQIIPKPESPPQQ